MPSAATPTSTSTSASASASASESESTPPQLSPVQRVLQLDAIRFDQQLHSLFHTTILNNLSNTNIFRNLNPHTLSFVLQFIQHVNTVGRNIPTPGHQLQALRFSELTKFQRHLHFLFDTLLPFILLTSSSSSSSSSSISNAQKFKNIIAIIYTTCTYILKWYFMRTGHYPSVGHLVTNSQVIYDGHVNQNDNRTRVTAMFQLVDRQLVWQGLAELALCIGPILRQIVSATSHRFSLSTFFLFRLLLNNNSSNNSRNNNSSTTTHSNNTIHNNNNATSNNCVVCKGQVNMAYKIIPCNCVGCYVCLNTNDSVLCSSCQLTITGFERLKYFNPN